MRYIKPSFAKIYLLVLLALCGQNSFAALTKWVDANGKVHYSDQPPPANVKAQILRPTVTEEDSASTTASAPAAPKTIAEREAELKKRNKEKQAAAEKEAKNQAIEDTRKENCVLSQQSLRTLQSGRRLSELDAAGERVFLDEAEIRQRTLNAQEAVDNYCK